MVNDLPISDQSCACDIGPGETNIFTLTNCLKELPPGSTTLIENDPGFVAAASTFTGKFGNLDCIQRIAAHDLGQQFCKGFGIIKQFHPHDLAIDCKPMGCHRIGIEQPSWG